MLSSIQEPLTWDDSEGVALIGSLFGELSGLSVGAFAGTASLFSGVSFALWKMPTSLLAQEPTPFSSVKMLYDRFRSTQFITPFVTGVSIILKNNKAAKKQPQIMA